ncbi:HtaA domain-containing protein [Arthrobacter sp. KNU-44]|uniref:HtaA domain-containing protein n=1 Tax=Arthrobacter sp. KNU-44 TaxID=3450744 RepID=UPI003F4216CC
MSETHTVEQTGLVWAIRGSFRRYVQRVARGRETIRGGAGQLADGRLYFPIVGAAFLPAGDGRVTCGGSAQFIGHAGLIDVTLASPAIAINGRIGLLTVETRPGLCVPLVDLCIEKREAVDGTLRTIASTQLREEAVALFDDVYPAGAEFDPLELRVQIM